MVYDLRENIRDQLALAQTIGGGFGAALGYRDYAKKQRRKEWEQQIQKHREQVLIRTIVQGQAEGWDNTRLHQEVLKTRGIAETELYQDWVMSGRSMKKQTDYPMEQFKYWAEEERKARKALELEDEATINNDPGVRFAREQKEIAMQQVNPDWNKVEVPKDITISPTQPKPIGTELAEPTEADLETYRRMGLEDYISPSGKRYPLKIKEKEFEEIVGPAEDPFRKAIRKQGPEMLKAARQVMAPPGEVDVISSLSERSLKQKVINAIREPEAAVKSYAQAIKKLGGTQEDIEDLRKLFREGNEQKIAEAIRRIGIY